MIKVFTTNRNNKIELTKEELKELLDEAYWEGYKANSHSWTYTTPSWTPYQWTTTNAVSDITISSSTAASNSITSHLTDNSITSNLTDQCTFFDKEERPTI